MGIGTGPASFPQSLDRSEVSLRLQPCLGSYCNCTVRSFSGGQTHSPAKSKAISKPGAEAMEKMH